VNSALALLLSSLYDGALAPEHRADLAKSGLSSDTIARQRLRSIPPRMIDHLLGFPVSKNVRSAYLIPFADLEGRWTDHVRLKIFPPLTDAAGHTVKYLQPRRSSVRLFVPLATLAATVFGAEPLHVIEGEKKSLAVAQLGLPAVGICGVEGWHPGRSRDLLPEFAALRLRERVVRLVPDGDVAENASVRRAVEGFAEALRRAGAHPRLVRLPENCAA
jgi:Domain of unknown function (DUF3854)